MRPRRGIAALVATVAVLALTACAGLPTSGPVTTGLALGGVSDTPDIDQLAAGPVKGAGPERIVRDFLDAAITPADNWATAQKFLTAAMAGKWDPSAAVTIDSSALSRVVATKGHPDLEDPKTTTVDVDVQLDQVGSVDGSGAYAAGAAPSQLTFRLVRSDDGEWRIDDAPPGIVLESDLFPRVFRQYTLTFFDPSWTHLVPDVRWYPRTLMSAATVVQDIVGGAPSPWLAAGVRNAFGDEVALSSGDSVRIDAEQVAEVPLNRAALSLDATQLARMRTQLESSLADLRVSEVRFSVDRRPLEAERAPLNEPVSPTGTLVITEDGFGLAGDDGVAPVGPLTAQVSKLGEPVGTIDVAVDERTAAARLAGGGVYLLGEGSTDELDARPNLIAPALDPYGYTWTVPRDDPGAVLAWGPDAVSHPVSRAFGDMTGISQLRVSADGARVAAVVTSGGVARLVVAVVIRDDRGAPVELGESYELTRLPATGLGLGWLGDGTIAVLSNAEKPVLITQVVGGLGTSVSAPEGSVSLAGGRTASAVRILGSNGTMFAQRGAAWQEAGSGILVLGTRAGQ